MSSRSKALSAAIALSLTGVVFAPHAARAGALDELGQSLLTQSGLSSGIITENPSSPISTQPLPAQATSTTQTAGGIVSESNSLPPVLQQAEGQLGTVVQNKADGIIGGVLGPIGSKIGNIFGGQHSGILSVFNPFEQLMQQYIGSAESYLHNAVADFLGSLFGHPSTPTAGGAPGAAPAGGIGTDVPLGAMGIPDPYAVQKSIEQNALSGANGNPSVEAQLADRFNLNPVVLSHSLSAEQDRTLGKTIAASVLSNTGQQAMSDERTAAAQTLQQIQAKAQEAQGMDVTQDVMKNLTAMVSGQSSLESGNYVQTMMIHQQLSANGVVESDISEALDETNRARHVEAMAGASDLMRSAASVYLPGS